MYKIEILILILHAIIVIQAIKLTETMMSSVLKIINDRFISHWDDDQVTCDNISHFVFYFLFSWPLVRKNAYSIIVLINIQVLLINIFKKIVFVDV